MRSKSKLVSRVSFLPAVVAGHPIRLIEEIEKLGYQVRLWQLEASPFGYGSHSAVFLDRDRFLRRELKRIRVLFRVVCWSHVIHCTFGSTLAGNTPYLNSKNRWTIPAIKNHLVRQYEELFLALELNLYRWTKKKLVIDFQGDDIRQREFQLERYEHSIAHVVDLNYYNPESDLRKRKRLQRYCNYGFRMNALNPDLLHYLPSTTRFMPYSNVRLDLLRTNKSFPTDGVFTFVHAPSNRSVKGTDVVVEAFNQLKSEGELVELMLVEGMNNSDALRQYGRAFMAIDQLHAGWYGGFAVECMEQGVPVISYLREYDLDFLSEEMREDLPIKNACPCNLKNEILKQIRMSPVEYEELSVESINYVRKWHNPQAIASEIVKAYQ